MVTDMSIINDIGILFQNKLVIYGAGNYGREFFLEIKKSGMDIAAYCETNPKKERLFGLPVLSQDQLKTYCLSEKVIIVIASEAFNEIYNDLKKKKIEGNGIITAFAVRYVIFLNIHSKYFKEDFRRESSCRVSAWKSIVMKEGETRAYEHFKKLMEIINGEKILVYQPGKVGSMSIYDSLKKYNLFCEHLHVINNRLFMKQKDYSELVRQLRSRKFKIITGVREPISREISAYAFKLQYWKYLLEIKPETNLYDDCLQYIEGGCKESYLRQDNGQETEKLIFPNEFLWFDKEIKTIFGVDIFDYPFDKKEGYSIINQGNVEIFVYKLEKLDSLESKLGEFIGVDNFCLQRTNQGENVMSKYLYQSLKENIKIPLEYLNYYYKDNEKCKHFYTDYELTEFMKKYDK